MTSPMKGLSANLQLIQWEWLTREIFSPLRFSEQILHSRALWLVPVRERRRQRSEGLNKQRRNGGFDGQRAERARRMHPRSR
jgi:hypothetical protein